MDSEQLSLHFVRNEFEHDGPMPAECVDTYKYLCSVILEPIRAKFNSSITVTSGYRDPAANAATHGVAHSQHEATANYCAADFAIGGQDMRAAFDWIRLESGLPFDQLILEHGASGDIIHISWAKAFQRREALEGATHNQSAYSHLPVGPVANA
ncbi:MAG: D-Ala-D-Ala carboxypeptidase family metallohydrolase [Chthoniobacterales bacterium]